MASCLSLGATFGCHTVFPRTLRTGDCPLTALEVRSPRSRDTRPGRSGLDPPLSFLFLVAQVFLNVCITPISGSVCTWPFPLCPSSPVPYRHSSLDSGPHLGNPGCSHLKNVNWVTFAHTVFSKEDKILPQAHITITLIYLYVRCNKCFHNNFIFNSLEFLHQLLLGVLALTLGRDLAGSLGAGV